ncbi:RNase A-like domain-containing protein [Klebsiella pneumoniae]|jgi:hypothetical protein|uniref:RNase A-like domain-containing protein n=1 Tax=Klebsiella variicola TaxID=244366 RepID=UPI00111182A4|nr:RNase A-like domain-containing protein [Klebsiella variicola]MCP6190094.1 hypothetical protein [Klebsiella pneumoniae]DAV42891.1 MAG TPA: CdiI immunity protein [Caudoviricetes sp.]HDH1455621.1 hypothetical protein [Klebsiella quasipneumoniae subsp. quasipneumoniae]HEP0867142.1 hypothetical protein [Klebsiella pneumoniae subsp. pneumoniae]HBR5656574.1 hypothetical protein [Klebsiella pneumoniae]
MSSSTSQLQNVITSITVNMPSYSPVILQDHEAVSDSGPGGHTISRHVGKDITYLLGRFPKLRVASTFTNLSVAELSATEWFKTFLQDFTGWYNDTNRSEVKFSREVAITQDVGTYVKRDDPNNILNAKKINLVMKVEQFNGMPHFILTAFPIEG